MQSCRQSPHYAAVRSAYDASERSRDFSSPIWPHRTPFRLTRHLSLLSLPPPAGRVGLRFGDQSPASWFHVVPHVRSQCLICHVHVLLQGERKHRLSLRCHMKSFDFVTKEETRLYFKGRRITIFFFLLPFLVSIKDSVI